jgi:hypothetical protein
MIAPVIAVFCALVLALTWSLCSIATRAKSPATTPLSVTALGNLVAPNNQYFVARGSGGFEVGGESGPLISSDAPDTVTITSKRSTTNLTVQPGLPGGEAYLSVNAQSGTNEERLIIGAFSPSGSYVFGQVIRADGRCLPVNFNDASLHTAFTLTCGAHLTVPNNGAYFAWNDSRDADQDLLRLDPRNNLNIGTGSLIGTIYFRKHIAATNAGTPTVSDCGRSPSASGATDVAGVITVGTGVVISCALTYGHPYVKMPSVVLTGVGTGGTILSLSASSTSGFTIAATGDISQTKINFMVIQ